MPSSFFKCLILLPEYTDPIVPLAWRRVPTVALTVLLVAVWSSPASEAANELSTVAVSTSAILSMIARRAKLIEI